MKRWLDGFRQDVSYALRSFRRNPAFVLVAWLSLTLGIGATTAIFSVIYGVLIAPYPYAKPGEIWMPEARAIEGRGGHTYTVSELRALRETSAFADVMSTSIETVLMTGEFSPESFNGVLLTGNAFQFLGVPPVVGRTLQPSDIRPDGSVEPVVVLSHRLWLRLFDGSAAAIGRTLRLDGRPHTIVGVMPPRFGWYGNDGFWLPLSPARTDLPWTNPIVRLAPGVSPVVAEQQLSAVNQRLARERPETFPARGFRTNLRNYLDVTVASGEMRDSLRLLLGAVGFLLLIACANVANLQFARGITRAREIAVRTSMGADRRRVLRQLLTESVLLSVTGGVLGVLFAIGAVRVIVALMPEFYVPNESRVAVNLPVLAFSLGVSVLTGIIAGLAPALQASKADSAQVLSASRSTSAAAHGGRIRSALVVVEIALSVVLLVCAGLTVRTFAALQSIDAGIESNRVMLVNVPLAPARYATRDQRTAFAEELMQRVRTLPGVDAVSVGFPGGGRPTPFSIGGSADESRRLGVTSSGADHLRTYAIPLRAGRMFDSGEVRRGDRVAVVNEAAAKLWPAGHDPIGSRLRLGILAQPPPGLSIDASRPPEVTVVGVIANTRNAGLRDEPTPVVVVPYSVFGAGQFALAVRAAHGDPTSLLNPIRAETRAMDAEQPLGRPITVREILGEQIVQPRFSMAMFSVFAGLGLVLAAAGIYSVLSFHVTRHTHEIGVRMALGASRGQVLGLMLGMGGRLVAAGLTIGVVASLAATRLLRNQLFGVQPTDPIAYVAVIVVLAAVTFLACYLPARRAASVAPMTALRQE
jgi:putative ABC transport system permease protein